MSVSYISPSLKHAVVLHGRVNHGTPDRTNVYKVCQVEPEKSEAHWPVVKKWPFESDAIKMAKALG